MPAVLFHQNMRTFAGEASRIHARQLAYCGSPPRRNELPATWPRVCPAYNAIGFPAIATAIAPLGPPAMTVCAIGLTELTNVVGARDAALTLSHALWQGGNGPVYMFNCGVTALGKREYTAIALAAGVTVLALGRVVIGGDDREDRAEVETPPFAPERWTPIPGGGSADYRFIVYAVIRLGPVAPPIAVGFIHNTYSLDSRIVTALRMPWLVERIRNNGVARPQHIYIGGDFNVEPTRPGTRHALTPYWVSTEHNTPLIFNPIGGRSGGTTWGGNTYDYWLSDVPWGGALPLPAINTATWDGPRGLMSDHVAILLQIA